jgi:transcription elongation factor Elf1
MNDEPNTNEANAVGNNPVGEPPHDPAPMAPTAGSGLLPCPFCGGEARCVTVDIGYAAYCTACGVQTATRYGPMVEAGRAHKDYDAEVKRREQEGKRRAASAWNRRTTAAIIEAVRVLRDQKGRHNTGIAYDRLMRELASIDGLNTEL